MFRENRNKGLEDLVHTNFVTDGWIKRFQNYIPMVVKLTEISECGVLGARC